MASKVVLLHTGEGGICIDRQEIVQWLLSGDVAIQYQTQRDLLKAGPEVLGPLKERIAVEGWGREFLERMHPAGYWGRAFYQPKWTSSHYTLLDLRSLCIPTTDEIRLALAVIVSGNDEKSGKNPSALATIKTDLCILGMFLNYACYFGIAQEDIVCLVDDLIRWQLPDGGFNCRRQRSSANHSSVHTTINVLEGVREYILQGYKYRCSELLAIEASAGEFLLRHHLFRSSTTGAVIHPGMTNLVYPPRWKYDILRALDYFRRAEVPLDYRMGEAIALVKGKRKADGLWYLPALQLWAVHLVMEQAGKPSRWNTLRAMRVLDYYDA